MGAFLNGFSPEDNVATVNGTYVSVKTINCSPGNKLCPYYVSNAAGQYATEMNGFTKVLEAKGFVFAGSNILKIAIADGFDGNNPSWLFIGQGSLSCPHKPTSRPSLAPKITKLKDCAKLMKGCSCDKYSRLQKCVRERAVSYCSMPSSRSEQNIYTNRLIQTYKSMACK